VVVASTPQVRGWSRLGWAVVVVTAGAVIPAVVPPPAATTRASRAGQAAGALGQRRAALPLPDLPPTAGSDARPGRVYGLSALDTRGRLADRVVWRALGWTPGTRLQIRTAGGLVVVDADPGGAFAVTRQGHVRIPATIRHWCGLAGGDRLLLAADPALGRLVVYPPEALDRVTAALDAAALAGDGAA
jgi:hypothetical protein